MLKTSDWISLLALIIASSALALELRRWFESGPKLHLSLMADAVVIPDDGRGPRLSLFAINRGSEPTMITHMVLHEFPTRWQKWRRKATFSAIVNSLTVPSEVGVNQTWSGQALYDPRVSEIRARGNLYVGLISAHRRRSYVVRVPKEKPELVAEEALRG